MVPPAPRAVAGRPATVGGLPGSGHALALLVQGPRRGTGDEMTNFYLSATVSMAEVRDIFAGNDQQE